MKNEKNLKLYELRKNQTDFPKIQITNSKICADFIKQFYNEDIEIYESCFLLLLNQANNTIGYSKISQGGIVGTIVDIRLIAKYAIESLATAVILAHNHPSGNLTPSEADKNLTKKVKESLNIFDIKLLDHLILTENDYYSFADNTNII